MNTYLIIIKIEYLGLLKMNSIKIKDQDLQNLDLRYEAKVNLNTLMS